MNIYLISFTDRGEELAARIGEALHGAAMRCGAPLSLSEWTKAHFETGAGLIFVGAAGIAVRAIAPHIRSKTEDPAVVVVDEGGRYAISLLSGHLGGANDLCRAVADITGGDAVITTATDTRDLFPVDQWARIQNLTVMNPARIRFVSGRLLAGETIRMKSDYPIEGEVPEGVIPTENGPWDLRVCLQSPGPETLHLAPRSLVLGVGCRKGIAAEDLEGAFERLLDETGLPRESFCRAASIDRKGAEPGLLEFCGNHRLPLTTCTPEQLRQVPGTFSASPFVERVTGVDNVCERSAVQVSGGKLLVPKRAGNGVTLAVAETPVHLNWRWDRG